MKQILTLLLALLALIPAFGQSVAIRSLGGFGTNLTAKGLSVSNVVAFDRYRWVTITNGQITFSGWNADVIGTVPGLYFKGTNGLVQGQIDVNSDHQTGQLAELRILTDYDGAIGWGYNREFQLGISGGQYNQKLKLQYADQIGNSHLFVFRARTNGQNAGFALNGFHSDQTSPSVDLDLYDVEPTWNTFPTAGFSNPGHKIMKISTNGTWVTSTFRSDGGFIGNGARITNVFGFNTNTAGAGMISNSMPVVQFNGTVNMQSLNVASINFTNVHFLSNTPPAKPTYYGESFVWNSNGAALFDLKASISANTWASTNLISPVSQSSSAKLNWSTSWASNGRNVLNNSPAYYLLSGTANSGSEILTVRTPAPFTGYVTNLWANLLAGSGAVQASTNCGVTLFTNGVASNFHGEMLGDGSRTIINVTNVGLYVEAGTLMSLQASNNAAANVSFTFNGTLQMVSP